MDIWLDIPSPVEAVLPRRVVIPFDRSLRIGRTPAADVELSNPGSSRQQCELGRDACGAWVFDRVSRNGTHLNGQRIDQGQRHRLRPDDELVVQDVQIRVGWDFEVNPFWRTWGEGVVVALAQRVRDEDDFAVMPILADALEDAGCTEASILEHLRGPGPHVPECWVIEALLGRK